MQRSIYKKSTVSRKRAAANAAVARARATILASRRSGSLYAAPPRTGGFWGQWNGRRQNELKTIDITPTSLNSALAGSVVLLNGVATGTDFNARIGRKIVIKSLLFRCRFENRTDITGATPAAGDTVRVLLVFDSQSNGAAPAVTDILNSASVVDTMNLNNRDRFRILKDFYITTGGDNYSAGTLTAGSPRPVIVKKYLKLNLEVIFSGTGATVGSIASGGLYFIPIADSAVANMNYCTRVRFIDG